MSADADQARRALAYKAPERVLTNTDFLSMGLTLGNLSACGRTYGGFVKGLIYRIIGKSQSAKTFFAKGVLAEAAINPNFADYLLIYNDIELGGQLISTSKFFGARLVERLRPPGYDKNKQPVYSRTIGDFYTHINGLLSKGKKFIEVVDSLDGLTGNAESKMGDGKAKIHSQELRKLITGVAQTGSILFFVQHAKVEIGSLAWVPQDVTTGGASPEYYSTLDVWLQKVKLLYKTIGERKYPIGTLIKAHIKKNRVSGVDRTFTFPLYNSYGIDDIGSCIGWLVYCGHWKGNEAGTKVTAPEFNFDGWISHLIKKIEKEDSKKELRILTGNVWKEIEEKLSLGRSPKYA